MTIARYVSQGTPFLNLIVIAQIRKNKPNMLIYKNIFNTGQNGCCITVEGCSLVVNWFIEGKTSDKKDSLKILSKGDIASSFYSI